MSSQILSTRKRLSNRILFAVTLPSVLFWLILTTSLLCLNAKKEIELVADLVDVQLEQFVSQNTQLFETYDFERIRFSASRLTFAAPIQSIDVWGQHNIRIFSKSNNSNPSTGKLLEFKVSDSNITVSKYLDLFLEFKRPFEISSGDKVPRIEGVLRLDKIASTILVRFALGFLVCFLFLCLQIALISYLTERALEPLNRFTSMLSDLDSDATQLPQNDNDMLEVAKFSHAYNLRLKKELELREEISKARADTEIGRIARQVAHDIRSPLSALQVLEGEISQLPENKRSLLRSAIYRIRDIANDLNSKHKAESKLSVANDSADISSKKNGNHLEVASVAILIDELVSEKRVQLKGNRKVQFEYQITNETYGYFCQLQTTEFKRVVSNIIDNSIDAIPNQGTVSISLQKVKELILIKFKDDGCGIPPDVKSKLGTAGFSYNKNSGSGLGLYHAIKSVESWNGDLTINSIENQGTEITIGLPISDPPSWFLDKIEIGPLKTIVVLDDDETIHNVWNSRFENLVDSNNGINLVHISTDLEFIDWMKENPSTASEAKFFMDYELIGSNFDGLSLISRFFIASQATLVTSRFDESSIVERCKDLGVKIIPKTIANLIQIETQPTT